MGMWRIIEENEVSLKTASIMGMLKAGDNPNILPPVTASIVTTGEADPIISGIRMEMGQLIATYIIMGKNKQATFDSLVELWNNATKVLHPLFVEEDVSGAQWYINVRPSQAVKGKGWTVKVYYDVPNVIWRKVRADTVWNVTSSPASQTMTMDGNKNELPIIQFTPTGVKADGFLWRKWLAITNPHTDHGFTYWGVCLTHADMDTRPWVKDTANYVKINNGSGITNSQTTIPYDTLTGDAALIGTYGMGYIDDGVNQEQIAWTNRTGTTSGNLTGVTRGVGGTTARSFADNVNIYLSRAQADGRDVRFYCDDHLQNIWITGFNTATSRIWYVAREPAGIVGTLGEDIASSGIVDEIAMEVSLDNKDMLESLPPSGVVMIDNEPFHYDDRDSVRFVISSDARALNDQPEAAHTAGADVVFLAHDYWIYSGNPNLAAQATNDARKPILTHSTSDNNTRDYTEFGEPTNLRANAWKGKVEQTSYPRDEASIIYTGNHLDQTADPYTEMGMRMQSVFKSGWRSEDGKITWMIYDPAGIDQVVEWVYEKYRTGTSWPAWVKLEKSKDGEIWVEVVSVSSPASASSWGTPITVGPYSLGTGYYYLRVILWGGQGGGASGGVGYISALETNSLKYETVSPLDVYMGEWNTNSYEFNGLMRNSATGHYFKLEGTIKQGETIEVDCAKKIVKTLSDNKHRRSMLKAPVSQNNWMEFQPGDNPLTYTETNVTGMEINIIAEDRKVA